MIRPGVEGLAPFLQILGTVVDPGHAGAEARNMIDGAHYMGDGSFMQRPGAGNSTGARSWPRLGVLPFLEFNLRLEEPQP